MSAIINLSDLKTYSNDTTISDGLGNMVVAAVNAHIDSVTGRSFGQVQTVVDEIHDYAPVIFLRHQDVTEVTRVTRGRGNGSVVTLEADSYFVNPLGRLVLSESRAGFSPSRDYITVSYKYGSTDTPADLKLAALSLAADFYTFASRGNAEVSAEKIGTYQLEYAKGQSTSPGAQAVRIINRYRTVGL